MAAPYWKGSNITAVAQVWKGTITTTTTGHQYTVTLTDSSGGTVAITYTVVSADSTTTLVATGFLAAWNASNDPRVAAITATQSSGQVILTSDTAGVPFSAAASGTGTWSGTGNTTSNASSGDWGTAVNWSTGAVPVNGDDVVIDYRGSGYPITCGLNQSAVTLNSLKIYMGAPDIKFTQGNLAFPLRISATTAEIGLPATDGSTRTGEDWYIDFGSNAVDCRVYNGANAGTDGWAPILISGNSSSNKLTMSGNAVVWLGRRTVAETCNFPTIVVNNGKLTTGTATTVTTYTIYAGEVTLNHLAGTNTLNFRGGETTVNGAVAGDTLNGYAGTAYLNMRQSGNDIDDLNLRGASFTANFTENTSDFAIDGLNVYEGGKIVLSNAAQMTAPTITLDAASQGTLKVAIGK